MKSEKIRIISLKIVALLLLFLSIFFLPACKDKEPTITLKTFSLENGLEITLDSRFSKSLNSEYENMLQCRECAFIAVKETFEFLSAYGFSSESSLNEYANAVVRNNGLEAEIKLDNNGLTYFDYEKSLYTLNYQYKAYVFKGSDAFWLCTFYCYKSDAEEYLPQFVAWANTINVK